MGKQSKTIRNKRKIKVENYENEYVNDNGEAKKQVSKAFTREAKFTILSIFVVTIVMISSAYAIFSTVQKQESYNTLTVGTLKIDFDATSTDMGNIINLNGAYPTSDEEGQKTNPYSFRITNSGTLAAAYKVKIIDDQDMINEDKCQDNLLPKANIKVSINGGTPFLLNSVESNEYVINSDTLNPSGNKNFAIRIWIDENSGNEVLGKHYHGKIVVEGQNKQANQNIEAAYIYNESAGDTQCINGEEATCQITNCYTDSSKDSCKQGTVIKYKVNDTESKYFYVLHDDGSTITMQQRENTVRNIPWYKDADDSTKGPLTILSYLEAATATWTNVEFQEYTAGYTNFYQNAYTGCTFSTSDYKITCSVNTYNGDQANLTLSKRKVRARMITAQEASSTGCLVWKDGSKDSTIMGNSINAWNHGSCPDWMHNYLYGSKTHGGSYEDNTVNENGEYNYDYWTMSAYSSYSHNAWTVGRAGHLDGNRYTSHTVYGARAVVVINK